MRKSKYPQIDLENFQLISEQIISAPPKRKNPHPDEVDKLEHTRAFGGLFPEESSILKHLCATLGRSIPTGLRK